MAKILFKRDITPNSDKSELNAPANTAIDIIQNTVFKSKNSTFTFFLPLVKNLLKL